MKRRGVAAVTREQKDVLTPDLGGSGTTEGLADAVIEELPNVSADDS